LLAGGYRDPLVGRDTLIGAVFGAGLILCGLLTSVGTRLIGQPAILTLNPATVSIGSHLFIGKFLGQLRAGIFLAFFSLFLVLLFFMVSRRERLAFGLLWLLLTIVNTLLGPTPIQLIFITALSAFLVTLVLYRYGLLAAVSALFFAHLWVYYPMTTELTAWYATDFVFGLIICLALAAYSFYISLAGQSLLAGKLLED
jgi:hypothetical protein